MAKVSAINKNDKRIKLSDRLYKKRLDLKKIIMDKKLPLEERFKAFTNAQKLCQK
jgi:small subunit ribosomal protein S14